MARSSATLALLVATTTASAQNGWDIPHRGAIVYDRQTDAFEITAPPSQLHGEQLIAGAAAGGHEWRYFACPRASTPTDFEQPQFDDSAWPVGRGEFSPQTAQVDRARTPWSSETLCLRTDLTLRRRPKALVFDVDHDDGVRIWLNGSLVVSNDGYGRARRYIVSGDQLDAVKRGANLLAARCDNIGGAQYLDIALTALESLPRGERKQTEIQKHLREARESANKVRRELFGAYRAPPLLLQGELDRRGRRVARPPADLRDIAWWLATDLRGGASGGSVQAEASRMFRLGDLTIKGRFSVADSEGWQTLTARVRNRSEPAEGRDSSRYIERFVMPHVWYGFDGELTVRRRLERRGNAARIVEFSTQLVGRVLRGRDDKWKHHAANLEQRETWKLAGVRDGQDAEFRAMVNRAIAAAVKRLKDQIKDVTKGNVSPEKPGANRTYHSGRLALALLALVKAGVPKDDEIVQAGYAALRQRTLIDTYSLGNAIMAIAALYAPRSELSDLKAGVLTQPTRRTPSPEDRKLLQKWTDTLLSNADTRVDPAYLLRFHYIGGGDFDNSVNQYGLLGLYSAHLCGIEIPAQVWEAAANHLLASQRPEGPGLTLELVDYRSLRGTGRGGTKARIKANARGWNYKEPKAAGVLTPNWGSMTCAGVTGLAICQAALKDHPHLKRVRLQNDVTRARHDGFAWLAQHMTLRYHAGAIERQRRFLYYYAYSLERAALLCGVALIQDRDWYFEAAMVLTLAQKPDGNWPGELHSEQAVENTAMALLCLVQSTAPVLTGK